MKKHLKFAATTYTALAVIFVILIIVIMRFPHNHKWESGKTKFYVSYSSIGTALQGEINIKVSENGEYEFVEYDGTSIASDRKVVRNHTFTLTDGEMEELFDYMINKVDFFKLKKNLSSDRNKVMDASFDYLEVKFDGNVHRIGGYAASLDKTFIEAFKKLHEISEKHIANE